MIKKVIKVLAIMLVVAFVAIQFFRPTFSNPPVAPGQTIEEFVAVPAEVQMVLARSCNDCHSNKTIYPWYSQIAPVSWFLDSHIDEGREHLNFSEWGSYSTDKRIHKLDEVCEMVEGGSMPLPSYLWIHRDAGLSPSQRTMLCDWAKSEARKLSQ